MMNLGEGSIVLSTQTGQMMQGLSGVERRLQATEAIMTRVGAVARTMFLVGGAAIGYAVKKFSESEEVISKFQAVFKMQAGAAEDFAERLGDALGRSKTDLMAYMATLQDTFVPMGFARDEGRELSQILAQLTVDLSSFNNQAEADVLSNLQSALMGNGMVMKKYGVILNETTTEMELFRMGIAGGNEEATDQQKVMARLRVILASTTDAQGDAARTAEGLANQMRSLWAEFKTAAEVIGSAFAPEVKNLIGDVRRLTAWVGGLDDADKAQIVTFTKWGAAILGATYVISKMIPVVRILITVVQSLAAAQIFLRAMSGPAGWAVLAAGMVIAVGTMAVALNMMSGAAVAAGEATAKAGGGVASMAEQMKTVDELTRKATSAMAGMGSVAGGGFAKGIKKASDELAKITAEQQKRLATEFGGPGATPRVERAEELAKVEKARKANLAGLDQHQKELDAAKKDLAVAEAELADAEAMEQEIMRSPPGAEFPVRSKEVEDFQKAHVQAKRDTVAGLEAAAKPADRAKVEQAAAVARDAINKTFDAVEKAARDSAEGTLTDVFTSVGDAWTTTIEGAEAAELRRHGAEMRHLSDALDARKALGALTAEEIAGYNRAVEQAREVHEYNQKQIQDKEKEVELEKQSAEFAKLSGKLREAGQRMRENKIEARIESSMSALWDRMAAATATQSTTWEEKALAAAEKQLAALIESKDTGEKAQKLLAAMRSLLVSIDKKFPTQAVVGD